MSEKERLEGLVGKLTFEKVFTSLKTFSAFYAAEAFCKERGFSVGSMQREAPIGVIRGDYNVQKWRNLRPEDKKALDGFIVGEDKRNGPVTVLLLEDPNE